MKKIIALSFLFIFLFANTEMGQLLKIPNLIEHFLEHRNHHNDNHSLTFFDFVKSHYNDSNKHSNTDKHDEHKNLPFKTINSHVNTLIAFENQLTISFIKPVTVAINDSIPYYREFYTSNDLACIWLPPKVS